MKPCTCGNVVFELSDHLRNFLIINKFSTVSKNLEFCRRDFSSLNEIFSHDFFHVPDWLGGSTSDDANSIFGTFYSTLSNLIDKHIPNMSKRQIKCRSKA